MAKIYMEQKPPMTSSVNPLLEPEYCPQQKTWIEKYSVTLLKITIIFVIITMGFLILTQQLLNREITEENIRLRKLLKGNNNNLEDKLYLHPLYDEYSDEFESFKQKFNKKYITKDEEIKRKLIFLNKIQEIEKLNDDESDTSEYDYNEFSDLTDEEFKQLLLPVDYYKNLRKNSEFIKEMDKDMKETAINIPPKYDWREKGVVTPIRSQHHCGSCWAFATVATVESAYAIAHGELRNLSEQELLDCNLENNACNGGDVDKAFKFVHETGLMKAEEYPYVAHRQNSCALASDDRVKVDVAYWLNPTEDSMIDWLLTYGPVNVGIAVPPSMQAYKNGVYKPTDYDCKYRVLGLHALLVVGYGQTNDGEPYWIVKNSWGTKWADYGGYVYFARGINACGIEDEPIGILA